MPVSSASADYKVVVSHIQRDDYDQLKSVWERAENGLSHSRAPSCLVSASDTRNIRVFKLLSSDEELVAYFPFEESKLLGLRVIRPAFYDLTLDMIDLCVVPEWKSQAADIFIDWLCAQKKTITNLFMCSATSLLAGAAANYPDVIVEKRGVYYYRELPATFEDFLGEMSASFRQSTRRVLRSFDNVVTFEVTDGNIYGDELQQIFSEFVKLHQFAFPNNSAMLPHKNELLTYVKNGISDGTIVFARAREIVSGEVVAVELCVRSHGELGLYQRGRRTDEQFNEVGSWLLAKTTEWAIAQKYKRFEFLFGDQLYKRRYASDSIDAVSLTHFSSQWARYVYRIRQRLGRRIKSLR